MCCFKYGRSSVKSSLLVDVLVADLTGLHKHDGLEPADNYDSLLLALSALKPQSNLLGGLSFLPEDRLRLSTIACDQPIQYRTAFCRNGACLGRRCSPCPSCTGQPCASCAFCMSCTGSMFF
jgi:hypothetical protein